MLWNMHRKKWLITAVMLVLVVLAGGIITWKLLGTDQPIKRKATTKPTSLSAWVVDWQSQASLIDYEQIAGELTSVQSFAAYFDESDRLFITDKGKEMLDNLMKASKQSEDTDVYLTIVNDVILADESPVQKSPELLSRLVATAESREQHIADIMKLVTQYHIDGIEIDYERVEDADWPSMLLLIEELQQKLADNGKKLRVVLEARAPIEELELPQGPTYVMMAYNLYGTHSKAGPKADTAFITKLAQRMQHVPGEPVIALAAGGFDWSDSGEVTAVTEKRADELARLNLDSLKRDAASSSVHFKYEDDQGVSHTVWYADHITIKRWIEAVRAAGIHQVAIWRLGDLGELTLNELRTQ